MRNENDNRIHVDCLVSMNDMSISETEGDTKKQLDNRRAK